MFWGWVSLFWCRQKNGRFFDWISFEFLHRHLSHVVWVSKFQCGAQSVKTSLECWYHMYYLFYAVGLLTFGISRVFLHFLNPKKGGGIRMFLIGWYPKEAIRRLIPVEITYATHPSDSDQRMPSTPFMLVYSTLVSLFGWSSPLVYGLFAEDAVCHFQNWFT